MGKQFVPSIANLQIAKLEEECVLSKRIPELTLYRRFIDDLILLWDGNQENLQEFMTDIKQNNINIKLSWKSRNNNIHLFDLELIKEEGRLYTKSFFLNYRLQFIHPE